MARKALLIGINQYQSVNGLGGCVNDVTNLRQVMKDLLGFANTEIRVLADDRSTKSAIEDRLSWLVSDAKPGDLLVLHFSGHGSRMRVRESNGALSDQLDEVICPWDMDWDSTFITDDYLRDHLNVPSGVTLEAILDCCHSGQDAGQGGPTSVAPAVATADGQPRFASPPLDVASRHEGDDLPTRRLLQVESSENFALWAACAADATAADTQIGGISCGAFTFYFCEHLRASQGKLTRAELLTRVQNSLARAGYAQQPELCASGPLKLGPPFQN